MSSLPMHFMSLFKLPEGVPKDIEKIQAAFLWCGSQLSKKVHMVKWEVVTKSQNQGDLGIRRVRTMNECLLVKWQWRFWVKDNSLWKNPICSKYNALESRWFSFSAKSSRFSLIWKGIMLVALSRLDFLSFFQSNFALRWVMED